MPAPRNHLAGYVDGAVVCVAGGRPRIRARRSIASTRRPRTWTHRATLPTATSGAAAALIGRRHRRRGRRTGRRDEHRRRRPGAARRRVDQHADAGAAARHRVRRLPRPALDVRWRNRARLPCRRRVHVARRSRSPGLPRRTGSIAAEVVDEPERDLESEVGRAEVGIGPGLRHARQESWRPRNAPTSASLPSARRQPRSCAIRCAITASFSASFGCSVWKPISSASTDAPFDLLRADHLRFVVLADRLLRTEPHLDPVAMGAVTGTHRASSGATPRRMSPTSSNRDSSTGPACSTRSRLEPTGCGQRRSSSRCSRRTAVQVSVRASRT